MEGGKGQVRSERRRAVGTLSYCKMHKREGILKHEKILGEIQEG